MKSKNSKGIDNISTKIIKNIKNEIALPITNLVNKMINDGLFPDKLKIAKIIPIYKKNDLHLFENYRPISILPSFSKIFEKILYNQMFNYFTNSDLFYKSQYGFRSLHSTEYAALELIERIIADMDQNLQPMTIFMDFSKAFDTLNHKILLHKLKHYGFSEKSIQLITSYLGDRFQYVNFKDASSEYLKIECGVPQGSILGPFFFIVYINDITTATKLFTPLIYADDTTLFTSLQSYNSENIVTLNQELKIIVNWLKSNKLSLNTQKTKAMHFHMPPKKVIHPLLYLDETEIEFVKEFNFLGLTLDDNLKWTHHIDSVSKKISKTLGIMTKLKDTIPTAALLNIYNALLLPYINYCLIIWGYKSERLFKLQKRAVRTITKSKYNAHTEGLFKALRLLKINDLCKLQDLKFCHKLINNKLPLYFLKNLQSKPNEYICHAYNLRKTNEIRLPAVKHEFAKHSINYRYPATLNSTSINIKEKFTTHSLNGLKFYFKRMTVDSYNYECDIPNCYVCQTL